MHLYNQCCITLFFLIFIYSLFHYICYFTIPPTLFIYLNYIPHIVWNLDCALPATIGQTNITHAYLMECLANPPECKSCRVPITVKHILVECRKFTRIQNKYYNNPTLSNMLAESSNFSITNIVKYLKKMAFQVRSSTS